MSGPSLSEQPDSASASAAESVVDVPIDIRSLSLAIIAFIAVLFTLKYTRQVLIPITLAMGLSYALMPLVECLKRRLKIPIVVGAALVLVLVVGAIGYGLSALQPQALQLLDLLPKATRNLESALHKTSLDGTSAIKKLTVAADAIENAANGKNGNTAAADSMPPPGNALNLREYLWTGTSAIATALGQAVTVIALTFFLLISEHAFKRKIIRITGTSLRKKKITVKILDEINAQIQRYLFLQIVLSAVVGLLTGLLLAAIGLQNALFWGVAAGVLHLIPYVGPTFAIGATSVFAFLQFNRAHEVLLVASGSLLIVGIIGLMVLPWLTGRTARINAISTFVGLLLWDWLWGVPGLLLGIPIMMAVMAVCERVEEFQPIAALMSQEGHAALEEFPL